MSQTPVRNAREQFGRNAANYARSAVHASGDTLEIVREWARPRPDQVVLDAGAGAGFTAFALAPHVRRAVAYDPTVEMLAQAKRLAHERGLANVCCLQGTSEYLPSPDASYDCYTCRMAAHHFSSLDGAIRESRRVLRPGGTAIFVDIISPPDRAAGAWQDRVERLRDPSHERDYQESEWVSLMDMNGFEVSRVARLSHREVSMVDWALRSGASPEARVDLRRLFAAAPSEAITAFAIVPRGEDFEFTWPALAIQGLRA